VLFRSVFYYVVRQKQKNMSKNINKRIFNLHLPSRLTVRWACRLFVDFFLVFVFGGVPF